MELRAITEQNYQKILDLSTGAGQEEFVARDVGPWLRPGCFGTGPAPMPCMKEKSQWVSSCWTGGRRKRRRRSGG